RAGRRPRAAVPLVNEDQVEVAVVTQFAAAQLAQADQGAAAGLAAARPVRQVGDAEARQQRRILQGGNLPENRFRQVAQGGRRLADRLLAQDVADADAQQFLVLEAVQDGVGVGGAAAQAGQLLAQLGQRARLVQYQAVEQLV